MDSEKGESSGSVSGSGSGSTEQLEGTQCMETRPITTHTWSLFDAARMGCVEFLREALKSQSTEYFLSQEENEGNRNFIHIAATGLGSFGDQYELRQVKFMQIALESLPAQTVLSLMCANDERCGNTPFHYAASGGGPGVELLVDIYKSRCQSLDCSPCPPWLVKNRFGDTPLHVTFRDNWDRKKSQNCASYLLDLDMENLCNSVNLAGHTPLSLAIDSGFDHIAQAILNSGCQYSLTGPDGFSLLHLLPSRLDAFLFVPSTSSVEVCRLLLVKHLELLKDNNNIERCSVLHKWAKKGKLWPLELLVELNKSSVIDMVLSIDHQGATPLHVAWTHQKIRFAKELWDIYKKSGREGSWNSADCSLWAMQDSLGNTPFHLALYNKLTTSTDIKIFLDIMSENPRIVYICNNAGESPLFAAVNNGYEEIVRRILELPDSDLIGMPLRGDGSTVLHVMFRCGEKVGELLVNKFCWLIKSIDSNGKTPLQEAEERDVLWAKNLLSKWTNVAPYATKRANFDWIEASKRGHSSALIAFISHYPDFLRSCFKRKDTPLHHIKLHTSNEYQDFLANPLVEKMKNMCDHDGATPLHRALERKDILLAETLLTTDGVDRSMRNKNNKTASDLLAELCEQHPEWSKMCVRIQIYPWLRPSYVQPMKTNMTEMRQTLSVVAALLATLTFAAGFTLPGGFSNDNGEAIMAKKATFLVFILADTIAMCCSMWALFCLIWSMVCDIPDKSVMLIDRSVVILMLALYGTLVAFMSGVFTVISDVSLWAAIVICVICSLVGISATRTFSFRAFDKLNPPANLEYYGDRIRLLEQGKAFLCGGGDSQKAD